MFEGQAMAGGGAWMTDRIRLGRSDLEVPRLGVGAMTWGSPSGRSRWGPGKLAYGGAPRRGARPDNVGGRGPPRAGGRAGGLRGEPLCRSGPVRHRRDVQRRRLRAAP